MDPATKETLNALLRIMNKATDKAEQVLDETLSFVAESNARIEEMEKHKLKSR